jgi:hypothetical protein
MAQAHIVGPNPTPELLPMVFHELRTEWLPIFRDHLLRNYGAAPLSNQRWASASVNVPSLLNYRMNWGDDRSQFETDEAILLAVANEVAKPLLLLKYPDGGWVERRPLLKEALAEHIEGDFDDWFQRKARLKGEWNHSTLQRDWLPVTASGFRQMVYGRYRGHTWDAAPISLVTNIRRITLEE